MHFDQYFGQYKETALIFKLKISLTAARSCHTSQSSSLAYVPSYHSDQPDWMHRLI